jgi:uncharacterized protein with gpF-like domain
MNDFALEYDRFYRRYEKKYEKIMSREIRKQISTYIKTQEISQVSSESMTKAITDLHIEVGLKWAKINRDYSRSFKRERFADYMFPLLRTYMIMDSLNAGEQITQTTIDFIKDLLYQATILNWSLQFLNNELLRIEYIRNRGMLIARTEITYATNLASQILMREMGYTKKRWVGILDKRTRRSHRILHGQVKPLTEPFQVVDNKGITVQMNYPGDRSFGAGADQICNCRCFLVYE